MVNKEKKKKDSKWEKTHEFTRTLCLASSIAKALVMDNMAPCTRNNSNDNNKDDFKSAHLPHRVGAQGTLQ